MGLEFTGLDLNRARAEGAGTQGARAQGARAQEVRAQEARAQGVRAQGGRAHGTRVQVRSHLNIHTHFFKKKYKASRFLESAEPFVLRRAA